MECVCARSGPETKSSPRILEFSIEGFAEKPPEKQPSDWSLSASPNLTHLENGKRAKGDSSLRPFGKNHFRMNCLEAGCLRQDPSWGECQSVQFNSVAQLYPTLCNPMDYSTLGFPVLHQLLEFTQTHVHWVSDAIQPSHPLSSPSPPAFNLSQHQGLFKWVSSSHQVTKVLEFQLQHQSFQWIFRDDFL